MKVEIEIVAKEILNPIWVRGNLVRSTKSDTIVLFAEYNGGECFNGTVLFSPHEKYEIGYYQDNWRKDSFELITETIKVVFTP